MSVGIGAVLSIERLVTESVPGWPARSTAEAMRVTDGLEMSGNVDQFAVHRLSLAVRPTCVANPSEPFWMSSIEATSGAAVMLTCTTPETWVPGTGSSMRTHGGTLSTT